MEELLLQVDGINKSFGQEQVLNNIHLDISPGEIVGLIGPNGAGKTTLIRTIVGLVHADTGTIMLNGYNIKREFKKAIAQVGAIIETPKFYPHLTGLQNLLLIANIHKVAQEKVLQLLEMVGLDDQGDKRVGNYSLGMKQRLGLARALVNNPKLIILDEPMNGLDPQGMFEMRRLIKELQKEKKTSFLISSHLLNEIEQACDKITVLKKGQVVAQGRIEQLLTNDVELVELYTSDNKKAENYLKALTYVYSIEELENSLLVKMEKGLSAQLNQELLEKGIIASYIIPQKSSLENYFINL